MLGGKNAKFLFLGVNGAAPCYKSVFLLLFSLNLKIRVTTHRVSIFL